MGMSGGERVGALWRYPIKSMMGEAVAASEVTARGLAGDRARALVDAAANRAAVVRSWGQALMTYRAQYTEEPQREGPSPRVRAMGPDGEVLEQADIAERLSAVVGRTLRLLDEAPDGLLIEFPAGTLSGRLAALTEAKLAADSPAGTFFDAAPLHLIARATIAALQAESPQADVGIERFRANLVVEGGEPFAENRWVGRQIAIGEVVLKVSMVCPRCVNVTLPQAGLARLPGLLKTIAQANAVDLGYAGMLPCAGVYASIVQPGRVEVGDSLRWLD
jgi:uncharacterized protein YcbX